MITKRKVITISVITFLIPIIIFVIIICFAFNQIDRMGNDQRVIKTKNYTSLSEITPHKATVFFGDSITELCPLETIYADYTKSTGTPVINRGISSETTSTMLERLQSHVLDIQPKNLVMLMGVNDLSKGGALETIVSHIQQMIQITKSKSPQTHIILQAVYPINKSARKSFYEKMQIGDRDNQMIKELNLLLRKLAKDEKITFFDVSEFLTDNNGELKESYTFDGLHPNIEGYLAVKEKIIDVLK